MCVLVSHSMHRNGVFFASKRVPDTRLDVVVRLVDSSPNDLEQNIVSLLTSRCKLLSKVRQGSSSNEPSGDSTSSTHSGGNSLRGRAFKLNSKFSSSLYRVRVPFLKKLAGSTSRFGFFFFFFSVRVSYLLTNPLVCCVLSRPSGDCLYQPPHRVVLCCVAVLLAQWGWL